MQVKKMRKIPTQTKTEVQVLIHDYHNFVWILLNCARPLQVLHHGILDMKNVLLFYYDLKGYENSQSSETVRIKTFKYKR
jgi:hypothetical protein